MAHAHCDWGSATLRTTNKGEVGQMSAEEQIRRLMGRYIQAHETHDVDTMVTLFAADGLFANANGDFKGSARIREFFDGSRSRATADRKGKLLIANSIITVDGDNADAF